MNFINSHYSDNLFTSPQRQGVRSATYQSMPPQNNRTNRNAFVNNGAEQELVYLKPTFWDTRLGQGTMGAGIWLVLGGGMGFFLKRISAAEKSSVFKLFALGSAVLGGLVGFLGSSGAKKEAKYNYEMKNDVDLIPVKGTEAYRPVYNDHKIEKQLASMAFWM